VVCGNITVWLFEKFINWEFEFLSVTYLASELLLLLVYWMMQDYVHKSDLPSTQTPTGDTERARELAREKGLTAKECEVLEMMLQGESRKQIAAELHVSENTVKTHVKHIYEKLGVGGREEIQAVLS
jgi:DNA-binding CsgD family transcriptional regulator